MVLLSSFFNSTYFKLGVILLILAIGSLVKKFIRQKIDQRKSKINSQPDSSSVTAASPSSTKTDEMQKDPIEKMYGDLKAIQLPLLKMLLGAPLAVVCNATTAKEARECFEDESGDESDLELSALLKWIELEDDLEVMSGDMYDEASDYHGYVQNIADKKWESFAMKLCEEATTKEELLRLYKLTPQGGASELVVLKKLQEFYKN